MISGKDIYEVFAAIVPLYTAMLLAYGSVRWWRVFTPDQCSGINRFVAVFAVPLLSFHFISTNNPYAMNYLFIAADTLQKLAALAALFLWHRLGPPRHRATLDWTITLFSLSTLPNTLVMGIPLLRAMYGDFSAALMVQIVVLQSVVWYTLMLFLFEYRAAKALIADQFPPEIAGSIASFRVDSDVLSLAAAPLQADTDVGADGRLRVLLRRSTSPSIINNTKSITTPRASNLTGVEIYSLQSSREPTPRGSSFNQSDFYAMMSSPASTGLDEEVGFRLGLHRGTGTKSGDFLTNSPASYHHPNPVSFPGKNSRSHLLPPASGSSKELHMYVWSASSASPASEANLKPALNIAVSPDFGAAAPSKSTPPASDFRSSRGFPAACENGSLMRRGDHAEAEDGASRRPGIKLPANEPPSATKKMAGKGEEGLHAEENQATAPPASVMSRLILIMVWRKLIRNPNTYSSLIGLVWSFVSFRWDIEMPVIIKGSIAILSDAGLGMAMFSLGLFMALQPKLIACGKSMATFSMIVRFLVGPAIIAATSTAIGVRGVLLHVAIVQAALPQGIVPFVFAKEYNCHPDILSTVVIFGMLVALPITILYYVLLGV